MKGIGPEVPFKIYRLTCKATGLSYIGQTRQLLRSRFAVHRSTAKGFALNPEKYYTAYGPVHQAINEHGWDSFVWEVLAECTTEMEAERIEQGLIRQLNTLAPNGYNIQPGGKHGKGVRGATFSRIMSEALKGKVKSNLTKLRMRAAAEKRRLHPQQKAFCSSGKHRMEGENVRVYRTRRNLLDGSPLFGRMCKACRKEWHEKRRLEGRLAAWQKMTAILQAEGMLPGKPTLVQSDEEESA